MIENEADADEQGQSGSDPANPALRQEFHHQIAADLAADRDRDEERQAETDCCFEAAFPTLQDLADQRELRNIAEVRLEISRENELTLLFDPGHALDERIVSEQFVV